MLSSVGASAAVTIVVDVDPSVADGSTISNTASVAANEADTTPGNNSDSDAVTVGTEADLSIIKVDSSDPVVAGTGFFYTITVINSGPSDAQGVVVTDALPPGVSFVSAVPSIGSCSESFGLVTCPLGAITDGDSETVVITVTVPANTADGTTLTNNTAATATTTDPNAANDTTLEATTVSTEANLSIAKTDSTDPVDAGDPLTYTLIVDNVGPSDAQSVVVVDTLPADVAYVALSPSQGSCVEAVGVVTCSLGTIADGGSATITIDVTVDPDVADGSTITNNASVASATTDPVAANNSTSENTTVGTDADLSITKSDSPDPVVAGNALAYTIGVSNGGPSDA